jgi:hypothetical protein
MSSRISILSGIMTDADDHKGSAQTYCSHISFSAE